MLDLQAAAAAGPTIDVPVLVVEEQMVHGAEDRDEFKAFSKNLKIQITRMVGGKKTQVTARPGIVGAYSFEDAFTQTYSCDAHLVQYCVFTEGTPVTPNWSRVNKEGLEDLETAGAEVFQTMVGIDLDTPNHQAWATGLDPHSPNFLPKLAEVIRQDEILGRWWAFYLTKAGARLIYRLRHLVKVSLVEPYVRGLAAKFVAAGITVEAGSFKVDPLADWTRLFRLPRVNRDGVLTHDTAVEFNRDARLDLLNEISPVGKSAPATSRRYEGEMPAEDDVEINLSKGGKWYEWKKVAIRTFASTDAGLIARGQKQIVEGDGQGPSLRNETLHSVIGQAIHWLYPLSQHESDAIKQQTGPETIYGLFLPAVKQFAPDESSAMSWPQTLWDHVVRLWSKEASKHHEKVAKYEAGEAVRQVEVATVTDAILLGVMQWSKDHVLQNGAPISEKLEIVKKKLIVSPGAGQYFLLRKDGYYRSDSVGKDLLIATMRHEGIGGLIDLDRMDEDGKRCELDEPTVLRRHAMAISCIEGAAEAPDLPGGKLVVRGGEVRLVVPLFGLRKDIRPEFNQFVDGWLRSFGNEKLIEYIQKALNFSKPVPLLGLIGPPSIGKQLLVRGFAETITTQTFSTETDLGNFNHQLMRTPFMSINEDVEDVIRGKDVSALIRRITAGDTIEANRKHKSPIFLNVPQRIIATANNDDVVLKLLGANKDQTPDDRLSLEMRTVFLRAGKEPAKYLEALGGQEFTGRDGARWVRGVDGAESNDIVAKHFLWIHKQNKYPPHKAGRFLMEGYLPPDLMHALSARSPHSSLVVKTLLTMVEAATKMQSMYGMVIAPEDHKDRIFVTAHEVVNYYEKQLAEQTRKPLNENLVGKALKGLRAPGTDNDPRFVVGRRDRKNRWTEVLLTTLLTEAAEYGYKSDNLTKLAREAGIVVEGEALAVA